jgi:hypothetical protein
MGDIMSATSGRSYDLGASYAPDDCPNGKLIHWAYATYAAPSLLIELPNKTETSTAYRAGEGLADYAFERFTSTPEAARM